MTTPIVNPRPRVPLKKHRPRNEPMKNDKRTKIGESLRSKDEMTRKTEPAVPERDAPDAPGAVAGVTSGRAAPRGSATDRTPSQ